MADITHQFALQVRQRSEDAPGDDVTFNLGEPQLHLVKPRGIGRSEMQVNRFMRLKKGFDRLALVRRQVVGDHVDLLAARLISHDVGKKRDELGRGVACRGLAQAPYRSWY